MKNSDQQHHVSLVFTNCQHEAKERIKHLPALRSRSHSSCTNPAAVQWALTVHLLSPNRDGSRAATSTASAAPWPAQPSCAPAWQKLLDCAVGIINSSLIHLLFSFEKDGLWPRWVCPFGAGGSAPRTSKQRGLAQGLSFGTETRSVRNIPSPKTCRQRSQKVPQGKVCSHCFAWGMFMEHLAGHHNPSCWQHTWTENNN